jgi:hypothetical protein
MYVARLRSRCILKRMPCTGCLHAPHCNSYEVPPGMLGLDPLVGTAITENPLTGITSLKLGFALSKREVRPGEPSLGDKARNKGDHDTGLTLRDLLHYLWDQAGLTQWQPGFTGRRSWSTVRKRILLASEGMVARGHVLRDWLYIPEVFTASRRSEIAERRAVHWMKLSQTRRTDRPLWLLLGEVKDLRAARCGFKAVIKHVPDLSFAMSHELNECVGRRFADELLLWGAANDMHLILLATFALDERSLPMIEELKMSPALRELLDRLKPARIGPVFPTARKSQPYTESGFKSMWNKLVKKGMAAGIIERRFTFHDLRAYYATQHKIQRGALPDLHANPATTARVYDRPKESKRGAL